MPTWHSHPAGHKEAIMKTPSHAETPFSQLLFSWAVHVISRTIVSIRPNHLAGQIAADVAATGNPSGV
jgi:hypothetical protein